jgi:Uma2 family endonuclease
MDLTFLLRSWLEDHPVGHLFAAPYDLVLSQFDVVEPDLIYLSNERAAEIMTTLHLRGAPELVVEIGSPSTRQPDETIKRHLYARTGVSEYWFVDPELDIVRVYRREGEQFARPRELSREVGDTLTTPLLAGLSLPLDRIFRE